MISLLRYQSKPTNMPTAITKVRKFVADGVFYAELNELLTHEIGEEGYAGVEVRVTPMRTEIIIRATNTQNVLGFLRIGVPLQLPCLCPAARISNDRLDLLRSQRSSHGPARA